MPFSVSITTEAFSPAAEAALSPRLAGLRFSQRAGRRDGFASTRSSDEATMLEDAAALIGELQRRGIRVERYTLDSI